MDELSQYIQKQKKILLTLDKSIKQLTQSQTNDSKRLIVLRKELDIIEKIRPSIQGPPDFIHNLDSLLIQYRGELTQKEDELKTKFGLELEKLLQMKGLSLEGQYPTLRTSFYTLVVDIPSNKVSIYFGPEIEKLGVVKAIPEEVADNLVAFNQKITGRTFDEKKFLQMLLSAYQMSISQKKRQIGEEIPLFDIHAFMVFLFQDEKFRKNPSKEMLSEYSRPMFSYDLSRLKSKTIDPYELHFSTATRVDTKSASDFFWVPTQNGSQNGETIARLKFQGRQ